MAYLDQLGNQTMESEEICNTLVERLKAGLEERPEDVRLLWRLSRAEKHLSMYHEQRGNKEDEKLLLQEGRSVGNHQTLCQL